MAGIVRGAAATRKGDAHRMLDCAGVNAFRLQFPDSPDDASPREALPLVPGVHAVGRAGHGRLALDDPDAQPLVQVCVDRRGVWLQLYDGVRGVHVNGRPVQRMAMLRVGDAIFVEGQELLLLGADPAPAPPAASAADSTVHEDPRMVLRGVGGQHHGRSITLDRARLVGRLPECDLRVDEPAFADRHARLEPHPAGAVLRDLGSAEGSVVNGRRVRDALLRPGDQVVFDAHHRFVVESPRPAGAADDGLGAPWPREEAPAAGPAPISAAAGARRVPWLLLAALLLAGALSLLLLYGVR